MAYTFRASASADTSLATSLTIAKPTGTVQGDLMVAVIGKDDDPTFTVIPTGWDQIVSYGTTTGLYDLRTGIWWKVAGASEPASYTWEGDSEEWTGAIGTFIPGNANPDYTQASVAIRQSGSDLTPVSNAVTTTSGNLLVAACTGAAAGVLDILEAGYTMVEQPSRGFAGGDTSTVLGYKLSAAGASESIEYDAPSIVVDGCTHPFIVEFDDVGGGGTATTLVVDMQARVFRRIQV